MTAHDRLRVPGNDELVFDAATCEEVSGTDGPDRLVPAPETTLFHQSRVARGRADAERHPSRLFANAPVNVAWRNGPVESVHAGRARDYRRLI